MTWEVSGDDLAALHEALLRLPGVEQVAAFGSTLHVTGADRARLDAALAPLKADAAHTWREIQPGLEDVFIHLMRDREAPPAS